MKSINYFFVMVFLLIFPAQVFSQPILKPEAQKQIVLSNISSMPLSFTENRGQWNEKALFKAEAGGATFFFCKDEVVYVFTRNTDELEDVSVGARHAVPSEMPGMPDKFTPPRYKKESLAIRAKFVGANPNAEIIPENRLSYNCNYFYGNDPAKWATDIPNYSLITYKDIYPGIDLKYHGDGQGMKYDFIVNPGADISKIKIKYDGTENLSVSNQGELEAQTKFGPVDEKIPQIYQVIDGQKKQISGHYIMPESDIFGFTLENGFNPAYPVVIDPEIVYSTYLGGSDGNWGWGIAVDGSGNVYITGQTSSTNFPTWNPYQTDPDQWVSDAIVTKLSPSGNSLIYSTYLGGNNTDEGLGIAVDTSGNAYITGLTFSTNFPTQNPFQSYQGPSDHEDAFVTKLSPMGNSIGYSTYLAGNDDDWGWGIVVDGSSNVYVAGGTYSTNFPIQNSYQTDRPNLDAFVTKLSPAGNSLIYSTYLGGDDYDNANSIAVDESGNAYVAGCTASTNFPTVNPYQTYQGPTGNDDVFVTKLSAGGNSLVYSTYLGENSFDSGDDIDVDGSGNAYVTGGTLSTNFPTVNPYQTYQGPSGHADVFVTKFSPGGNSLVYSTYLGGNSDENGLAIEVDVSGNAYVTGATWSTNFPTVNQYQTYQDSCDAFLTKLLPLGNSLAYSTYLGGSSEDEGHGITVDGSGNTYVTGETYSSDFPTRNPYQIDPSDDNCDVFITKFGPQTGIDDDGSLPSIFSLSQNYPNPFNGQTQINYALRITGHVKLSIYNLLGQKAASLFDGVQNGGEYSLIWNAADMPSGIYFARLETGEKSDNIKMMLLK